MTTEEMERAIGFLLEHHAKFSADIDDLKEAQRQLTEPVTQIASEMQADRRETREVLNRVITEMRDGFDFPAGREARRLSIH